MNLDNKLWAEIQKYVAGGVQTVSKHPDRLINGVYPKFISNGRGPYVYSASGQEYVDFICSLGPIILGHADPVVNLALRDRLVQGTLFSLSHPLEIALARKLCELIPSAEKVKFFKTGSDSTSAAVRVARAHTKRPVVVSQGYHGWHDWYQQGNPQNAGIPQDKNLRKFEYNDFTGLHEVMGDDVACVIMEPMRMDMPRDGYLQYVRKVCDKHGALLIFDEVLTGFRLHLGGAQKLFGVTPDLSCFSKAMGNGVPIAALVGKKEPMAVFDQPDFFVSGTFNGDLLGIVAALATIKRLEEGALRQVHENGKELTDGFKACADSLGLDLDVSGLPAFSRFNFPTNSHRALFMQECVKAGVLFGPYNFIGSSHSHGVVQSVLQRVETALTILRSSFKDPTALLEAPPPNEVIIR